MIRSPYFLCYCLQFDQQTYLSPVVGHKLQIGEIGQQCSPETVTAGNEILSCYRMLPLIYLFVANCRIHMRFSLHRDQFRNEEESLAHPRGRR